MHDIIARDEETRKLEEVIDSNTSQFIAMYGRRRVGKTFLISQFFHNKGIYFELTGIKRAKVKEQLRNFSNEFSDTFLNGQYQEAPKSWQEAFTLLRQKIEQIDPLKKVIIFLDELPWLASPKSGFLPVLDHTWNRYLSRYPNVILIVCGSAASWILKKIINDRGGFYGRITLEMKLLPYTLKQTEKFLQTKGIELEQKQIIELYMVLGGIPKYLEYVAKGKSPAQIVQENCFQQGAPLLNEFKRLFSSLFDHSEKHIAVIKILAGCRKGLTQKQIIKMGKFETGGSFSKILIELEDSGFIAFIPNNKKKSREGIYRLIDEYSLFFLTWIEPYLEGRLEGSSQNYWLQLQDSPAYYIWSGYSFEGICLKHVDRILDGLGLRGILTKASGWISQTDKKNNHTGAQIDLIIERADNCINLCEIKFSNAPYTITREYSEKLRLKKECYRRETKTASSLFVTMITPFGVIKNSHYHSCVDNQLTLSVLF